MKVVERIIGDRVFLEVVPDDYEEEAPTVPDPSSEGIVTVLVPDSYYER